MYFKYEQNERRRENMEYLYLCGVKYPGNDKIENCIDHNNSKYSLTSIINLQNAATCILNIQKIKKRTRLIEELKKNQ